MIQSIEENVKQYVAGWNQKEEQYIKAAFEKCLATGCTYTDKNVGIVNGLEDIVSLVIQSHEKFPGRMFSLISAPDYFDNKGRYYWRVIFSENDARDCMDYFEYNNENVITRIVGFL